MLWGAPERDASMTGNKGKMPIVPSYRSADRGSPDTLGVTVTGDGINVAVHAPEAGRVAVFPFAPPPSRPAPPCSPRLHSPRPARLALRPASLRPLQSRHRSPLQSGEVAA